MSWNLTSLISRQMITTLLLCTLAVLACGCAALRRSATESMVGHMSESLLATLEREQDLELVRSGAPAYILMLDAMAESEPESMAALVAACSARTAYAAAFLDRSESDRARLMFARARDYGLKALCRKAEFQAALDGPIDEFEKSLSVFETRDVPALYAAATAWVGWIINSQGDPEAMAQLSRPMALMRRILELDRPYKRGGADLFFGIYYAVQPLGAGRDLARSQSHFEKSFEFAGPHYLLPRVAYAEFYARYAFNRDLFEKTLKTVLADTNDVDKSARLANEVARKRARALLEKADDWF